MSEMDDLNLEKYTEQQNAVMHTLWWLRRVIKETRPAGEQGKWLYPGVEHSIEHIDAMLARMQGVESYERLVVEDYDRIDIDTLCDRLGNSYYAGPVPEDEQHFVSRGRRERNPREPTYEPPIRYQMLADD